MQLLSQQNYQKAYVRFLEKLRHARLEAQLTQAEVAILLGKPQSFVSKFETGERRLDVVELQTLSIIYKKDLTYFVDIPL